MTQEDNRIAPEHHRLARVFSSVWLMGPPLTDELLRLIAHLFSPEEARIARHLPYYVPRSARTISRRAGRPVEEVIPLLDAMSRRKVIVRAGKKGYALIPLIPGMFEYLLMDGADTPWRRRYAELINSLYSTGFMKRYSTTPVPALRFIPAEEAVSSKNCLIDSDLMSKMIDAHEHMAVIKVCQCRQSKAFEGKPCRKAAPEDGCLVFGSFARGVARDGTGRTVSREEMRRIVSDRWDKNLTFWAVNVEPSQPNFICTCCDCCCHLIESINHFNGRVCAAEPHFLADMDNGLCLDCGMCVEACNTLAHEMAGKEHRFVQERCIGCGLCVGVCPEGAVIMKENPGFRPPSRSWLSLGTRLLPAGLLATARAAVGRRKDRV